MGTVEKWAKFITELSYDDIPRESIDMALAHIIDIVGVALGGTAEPVGKIITEYTHEHAGRPEAGVFGAGFKTSVADAAFANGAMAHTLDYDDSYVIRGHPSAVTIPTILALGETLHISGKAVLEAYVAALEIMARVSTNMGFAFQHFQRGWHTTAIWGTLGACAAATKILGLDVEKTKMAFGIAGSAAGGLMKNLGTMAKSFNAGNANRGGVIAALLAKKGWTADPEIMDGEKGFAAAMAGVGNFNLEKMTEGLGEHFTLTDIVPGLCIKKYPCAFALHWALDATLHLVKEHQISHLDVESIELGVVPPSAEFPTKDQANLVITGGLRAKFSLLYVVSAAIVDGQVSLHTFDDDKIRRPEIKALMGRITLKENPIPPNFPLVRYSPVTITLKDGQKLAFHVDKPRGYPDMPITRDELLYKYRDCASVALPAKKVEESIKLLEKLPDIEDITPLVHILTRN